MHRGMCEASGAIAIPEGSFDERFLVVNNEDNRLRLYAVGAQDEVLPGLRNGLPRTQGRETEEETDLEAATWLKGRAVFAGSLSRSDKGKFRPTRQCLVSVNLAVNGNTIRVVDRIWASEELRPALAELDSRLAKAIGNPDRKRKKLSPKRHGINLEGLTAAADGISLMLGFRNPLSRGKALVVKLRNPVPVLRDGAKPILDPPYELPLGGLGVRSIEYSSAAGAYFIVGGPVDRSAGFNIFRWREGEEPSPIAGAAKALRRLDGFIPEGLMVDETGTRLRLFGDNGGCSKKDRSFPSVVLSIEGR